VEGNRFGALVQLVEDVGKKNHYLDSNRHNRQFVGRVSMPVAAFAERISEMGFEENPLADFKQVRSSWRLAQIGTDAAQQLHTVMYDSEDMNNSQVDTTYVYAHEEPAWDVHPILHLRGRQKNGPKGVRLMRRLLDENGIHYKSIRP